MVVLPPLPTNYKFAGFLRKEKATYASAFRSEYRFASIPPETKKR